MTLAGRLAWRAWPFELLTNFPIQIGIAALVVLACALALRAWVSTGVAVIALVVNAVVVHGVVTSEGRDARAGWRVTVGHLNAQTRPIDVNAFDEFLTTTRPAVFVLLDPVQADVAALRKVVAGYRVTALGSDQRVDPDFVRTVVLSRIPLRGVRHPADPQFGRSAVECTLVLPGTTVDLVAFGSDAPTTPGRALQRDRVLNAAARWSRAHGPQRIVMGDLNATPWSPSFRHLLRAGRLFDSLQGFGLQVTWPRSNPLLRIPIDHALLGPALAATDRGTGPSFGSEHRSLHVTVGPRA